MRVGRLFALLVIATFVSAAAEAKVLRVYPG
jgi:hypothetical protein